MPTKNYLLQAFLRNASLLLLGVLLVTFSAEAPVWIVRGCGIVFILPGVISLISILVDRDTAYMPMAPFTAGGSILFGIYLLCFPGDFIHFLLYALAGLLIMFGAAGCYSVWHAWRGDKRVSLYHLLFPTLLFVTGILVLVLWHEVATLPFLVIGYALIVYAPLQMFTAIVLYRSLKRAWLEAQPEQIMVEVGSAAQPQTSENDTLS